MLALPPESLRFAAIITSLLFLYHLTWVAVPEVITHVNEIVSPVVGLYCVCGAFTSKGAEMLEYDNHN